MTDNEIPRGIHSLNLPRNHIQRTLESPRNLEDRQKLFAKIEEDEQRRVLEKPRIFSDTKGNAVLSSSVRPGRVLAQMEGMRKPNLAPSSSSPFNVHNPKSRPGQGGSNVSPGLNVSGIVTRGGEEMDPSIRHKRYFIKLVSLFLCLNLYLRF